jgi:hypothetical protein
MATTKLQLNTTPSNGFAQRRPVFGLPNGPDLGISAPIFRELTC